MRRWIFKNYWWISGLGLMAGVALALCAGGGQRIGAIGAVVATILGFCYFVQQQKLAETELFHKLFTGFNARYDELNDDLARILEEHNSVDDLAREDRSLVVDYFNLCAEEYLFYREGFIHREVWRSWCRGMAFYLKRHPFKDVWNVEVQSESYYGLTQEVINRGAEQEK